MIQLSANKLAAVVKTIDTAIISYRFYISEPRVWFKIPLDGGVNIEVEINLYPPYPYEEDTEDDKVCTISNTDYNIYLNIKDNKGNEVTDFEIVIEDENEVVSIENNHLLFDQSDVDIKQDLVSVILNKIWQTIYDKKLLNKLCTLHSVDYIEDISQYDINPKYGVMQ